MCCKFCRCCESSLNKAFQILALIVLIVGLCYKDLTVIIAAIVISLIGFLVQLLTKKQGGKIMEKNIMRKKKAAIELSIGTIVIIVIALTMLILGIVLVRSIMCSAISLTSETGNRARAEVNKLFEATGGEIQCVGNGGEQVVMVPGKTNIVWCGIRAESLNAEYTIITEPSDEMKGEIKNLIKEWMGGKTTLTWTGKVSPGDELPKKIARLDIPKDAPEISIVLKVTIQKNKQSFGTQDLDFRISRQGLIRATMC